MRALRCGAHGSDPHGHTTPFIYMMTFEIDVIMKIERAFLGGMRERSTRKSSERAQPAALDQRVRSLSATLDRRTAVDQLQVPIVIN